MDMTDALFRYHALLYPLYKINQLVGKLSLISIATNGGNAL